MATVAQSRTGLFNHIEKKTCVFGKTWIKHNFLPIKSTALERGKSRLTFSTWASRDLVAAMTVFSSSSKMQHLL